MQMQTQILFRYGFNGVNLRSNENGSVEQATGRLHRYRKFAHSSPKWKTKLWNENIHSFHKWTKGVGAIHLILLPFISLPPPTHKQLIHNGSYLHSWMCFPVYTCTSRRTCIHTLCPNLPKIQIIRKVCFGSIRERQPYAVLCSITCYQLSLAFILSRMGLSCSFSLAHSRHICTWLISMRHSMVLFQWHSPLLTHNQAYTHSNWWYTHTHTHAWL